MNFKGFTNLGDATITSDVINNLVSFFDYGLVEKSGYVNVSIPTSGYYGGIDSTLRRVNDPRYSTGRVWQAVRQNWVYESGYGTTPQVYVNATLHSGNVVNYLNGTIIFNSGISSSASVTCNYSYKYVNVLRIEGLHWFEQVQTKTRSNGDFVATTGVWDYLPDNRLQLPAIGIELKNRTFLPWQIGGGQKVYTDVLIHCVAEDVYTRDMLFDIVSLQNEKRFWMYDLDSIAAADAFPLKNGLLNTGYTHPLLVSLYPYKQIRLFDIRADAIYSLGTTLHIGTVRCKTEVYLGV